MPAGTARYPAWLRTVLWVDGITGLASGLMGLAASDLQATLLGLPGALVQASAMVVLVFVALIAVLLAKSQVPALGLRTLVVGNALWVAASVMVVELHWPTLNALGVAYVLLQAGFVGALAYLQARAMRR
ncbi:hypothetical protein RS694_19770 [Rhodoferax saidenbachensis]|uniref:Integral membrane protein n=1 Tax=Rhodoferax saidenbachensis TaxID=1484693 RepID=A0A1P8KGA7_9BURK|nr:hypothetical protein RS694_19770 [Rhodoferax saidenbachensis]